MPLQPVAFPCLEFCDGIRVQVKKRRISGDHPKNADLVGCCKFAGAKICSHVFRCVEAVDEWSCCELGALWIAPEHAAAAALEGTCAALLHSANVPRLWQARLLSCFCPCFKQLLTRGCATLAAVGDKIPGPRLASGEAMEEAPSVLGHVAVASLLQDVTEPWVHAALFDGYFEQVRQAGRATRPQHALEPCHLKAIPLCKRVLEQCCRLDGRELPEVAGQDDIQPCKGTHFALGVVFPSVFGVSGLHQFFSRVARISKPTVEHSSTTSHRSR